MAAGSTQHQARPQKALTGKTKRTLSSGNSPIAADHGHGPPANGSPGAQPDADRRLPNRKTNSPATADRCSSAAGSRRPGLRGGTSSTIRLPQSTCRPPGPPAQAYRASRRCGPQLARLPGLARICSRPAIWLPRCRPVRRAVRPGDQAGAARGRARPLNEHRRHRSASPSTAGHGRPEPDDLQPPAHPTSATPSRARFGRETVDSASGPACAVLR
jgi:hypothetical protein